MLTAIAQNKGASFSACLYLESIAAHSTNAPSVSQGALRQASLAAPAGDLDLPAGMYSRDVLLPVALDKDVAIPPIFPVGGDVIAAIRRRNFPMPRTPDIAAIIGPISGNPDGIWRRRRCDRFRGRRRWRRSRYLLNNPHRSFAG